MASSRCQLESLLTAAAVAVVAVALCLAELGGSEYVDYKKLDAFNREICGRDVFYDWQNAETGFECDTPGTGNPRVDDCDDSRDKQPRSKARMSFGFEAERGEFPSHAQLEYNNYHFCQASIIHNDLLITAGHCARHLPRYKGRAYMGSQWRFDKKAVIVDIKSACILKGYTLDGYDSFNDVALLKLAKPVNYTRLVQPICLDFDRPHLANATCLAAGHGFSSNDGDSYQRLRAMPYKLYTGPNNDTRQDRSYYMAAHPTWAGNICSGDSGSALICYDNCSKDRTRAQAVGVVIDAPKYSCIRGKPVPVQMADYYKLREAMQELFERCLNTNDTVSQARSGSKDAWIDYAMDD